MLAVGYCRFSSEGQRDGYSIEAQERAIKEYCEREKITITNFYVDEAKTGTNDNRDQFQQLMVDATKHLFDTVIVHKFDRFARNKYDSVYYKKKLRDCDIKLISILEPLDDSPEAVILESLYEGMADYYSKNLGREVLKGKKEAALKCQHNGGKPPFGYDVDDSLHYVINESEADIIRLIFKKADMGVNFSAIAKQLNDLGYRHKEQKFNRMYIVRVITNELYKGTFTYGLKSRKKTPNIIKIDNGVDAIIDPVLFERVNRDYKLNHDAFSTKQAKGRNLGVDYILTGYLYCGYCGAPLTGFHSHKSYKKKNGDEITYSSYFYRCSRKAKRINTDGIVKPLCKLKALKKDDLENYILKMIETIIFDDTSLKIIYDKMKDKLVERMNKKIDTTKQLKEIAKLQSQLTRLLDLYLDASINKDDYVQRKNEIESQIKHNQTIVSTSKTYDINLFTFDFLKKIINKFKESWQADTIEYKKMTLSTFVSSIIIDNDKITIYFKFPIDTGKTQVSELSLDNYFLRKSTTVSTYEYLRKKNDVIFIAEIPMTAFVDVSYSAYSINVF